MNVICSRLFFSFLPPKFQFSSVPPPHAMGSRSPTSFITPPGSFTRYTPSGKKYGIVCPVPRPAGSDTRVYPFVLPPGPSPSRHCTRRVSLSLHYVVDHVYSSVISCCFLFIHSFLFNSNSFLHTFPCLSLSKDMYRDKVLIGYVGIRF
jgi:hypothetical protein